MNALPDGIKITSLPPRPPRRRCHRLIPARTSPGRPKSFGRPTRVHVRLHRRLSDHDRSRGHPLFERVLWSKHRPPSVVAASSSVFPRTSPALIIRHVHYHRGGGHSRTHRADICINHNTTTTTSSPLPTPPSHPIQAVSRTCGRAKADATLHRGRTDVFPKYGVRYARVWFAFSSRTSFFSTGPERLHPGTGIRDRWSNRHFMTLSGVSVEVDNVRGRFTLVVTSRTDSHVWCRNYYYLGHVLFIISVDDL